MEPLTKDDLNKLVRPEYRLNDEDVKELEDFWKNLLRIEEWKRND